MDPQAITPDGTLDQIRLAGSKNRL
jgi:hypothetical protein